MKTVDNYNFSGQKALIRVDFNVPLDAEYNITDDTRIRAALPTINKILKDGGAVILLSHLGRPKEGPTEKYSLKHVVNHLSKLLNVPVSFAYDCIGDVATNATNALKSGEVLLLENLRFLNVSHAPTATACSRSRTGSPSAGAPTARCWGWARATTWCPSSVRPTRSRRCRG